MLLVLTVGLISIVLVADFELAQGNVKYIFISLAIIIGVFIVVKNCAPTDVYHNAYGIPLI